MSRSPFHAEVVSHAKAAWSVPLRWALSAAEVGYEWVVARRNRQFDTGVRPTVRLSVPVISVGNITAGGTGKTPLVIDLARRLVQRGLRPAVVSRGYKSKAGEPGDELLMVSERVTEAVCVADPDRVAGGRQAIAAGAEVIVLDDAFQHRRVARDLDLVVVDATNPFGYERLLPRGLLREPVRELRRADLIVISRCDLSEPDVLARLTERIGSAVPVVNCRHRPVGLTDLAGGACEERYARAVLLSGIGNPEAFARTVAALGIQAVATHSWPDHHHYRAKDVAAVAEQVRGVAHDVVLTTAKDAVKLRRLDTTALEPVRVVEIEIAFDEGGERILESRLDEVLRI